MSRRAKCLIIAIFLVLLAVPVIYLALSWRPREALEFQAVSFIPNAQAQSGSAGKIDVLIVNKGHFPIRYYHGYLVRDGEPVLSSVPLRDLVSNGGGYTIIPPGKFVRAQSDGWNPEGHRDGGIRSPGINVRYYWLSSPRAHVDDWLEWWYYKRHSASIRFPKYHEGHAQLIPPPDSATVEP